MKKLFTLFAFVLLCATNAMAYDTWSVVGSKAIMNGTADWAVAETANDLTTTDGTNYTLTVTGKTLEAGTSYEFKFTKDHAWTTSLPASGNNSLTVDETAIYTIVYSVNVTTGDYTAETTKTGEAGEVTHTYSIAGSSTELFGASWSETSTTTDMSTADNITYTWKSNGVTLSAGDIKYKVVVDHAWGTSYGDANQSDGNAVLNIASAGKYNVVITFNANTHAVSGTATAVVDPTITLLADVTAPGIGQTVTFTVTTQNFDENSVTTSISYEKDGGEAETLDGTTFTPTEAGTYVFTASATGTVSGESKTLTSDELTVTASERTYYLKHPWGGSTWEWKALTKDNDAYTFSVDALYGGNGCNWNTTNSDSGSTWVASPTIDDGLTSGDYCLFTLDPVQGKITITKLTSSTLTVTSAGYATYYNSYAAYTMPEGLTGYIFKNGGIVETYTSTGDNKVVPAGEALVLGGEAKDYTLTFTTTSNSVNSDNALLGTDVDTDIATVDGYYLYGLSLAKPADGEEADPATVGFYWMAANGGGFNNKAHKAYLKLAKTPGAKTAYPFNDDEASAINAVETSVDMNAPIYNLAGQRVAPTTNGILIQNGKKFIIK